MTSVKPFRASPLKAGTLFPEGSYNLYAVVEGVQVVIFVTDKGVQVFDGQRDISTKFRYLVRQLSGLHKIFGRTTGPGLTSERQRAFDKGLVIYGQLEPRGLNSKAGGSPDDTAITVYTALPLSVYKHGTDTLGHSIRYQHFTRCLMEVLPLYDGTPPYIRPMHRVAHIPWFNCGMSYRPGHNEYWGQAHHEVLTNGRRDILAFDVYQPWTDNAPSCRLITCEAVRSHFQEDDEL